MGKYTNAVVRHNYLRELTIVHLKNLLKTSPFGFFIRYHGFPLTNNTEKKCIFHNNL